jgi:SAM-dependent methyltransferase
MARLGTFFSKQTLTAGLPYFEYQLEAAREAVIPWLERRMQLDGIAVADFGAHQGGLLEALRRDDRVASAVGIELNADVVDKSPFVPDERFELVTGDLTALGPELGSFDLIVLHDVLEHVVEVDDVLRASAARLAPEGRLLVVFPPYGSAFGGHQQLAEGWARAAPFLHLLPAPLFFRLARPAAGNEYMTVEDALGDMQAVRRTRLTLAKAERAFKRAGLETADRELFLVRPEHSLRYGIRARGAGPLGRLPVVRELAVSGAYYLLQRGD